MKILYILQIFAVFVAFASVAHAEVNSTESEGYNQAQRMKSNGVTKYGKYIWGGPYHDDVVVYLNEAKIPHNSMWADDDWSPNDWIAARGGDALKVINGFYDKGIVTDQYTDNGGAVLEVGRKFTEMSDLDKHRMVAFFDHVFNITGGTDAGVIQVLFHEETYPLGLYDGRLMIGLFTKDGLQLQ